MTGLKVITSILMPKEFWDVNGIRDLRFLGTAGLPPKIEAPHITLLDTFSCQDRMKEAYELFKEVAQDIEPFDVTLKELCHFEHGAQKGFTLYLNPEIEKIEGDKTGLDLLYEKLMARCPHFNWLESRPFSPHVSLGKIKTAEELARVKAEYGSNWQTITFTVREFQIMSKLVHDTVVRYTVPLGRPRDLLIPHFDPFPFPIDGTYSININWVPRNTTKDQLLKVFEPDGGIRAEVEFKSLGSDASYSKGWGNVVFRNKAERDKALSRTYSIQGSNLEIFACD